VKIIALVPRMCNLLTFFNFFFHQGDLDYEMIATQGKKIEMFFLTILFLLYVDTRLSGLN
jgi:hypothetical protein